MRTPRLLVWSLLLVYFAFGLSCARPENVAQPTTATPPTAQERIEEFEKTATNSKDPVSVWMGGLKDNDPRVLQVVLEKIYGTKDARLERPLEEVIARWGRQSSHDGIDVAGLAKAVLERFQADRLIDETLSREAGGDRLGRMLVLAKQTPDNYELQALVREEVHQSNDERIIPYLIADMRQESSNKLHGFGKQAAPYLIDAAQHHDVPRVRRGAIADLGIMKVQEAVPTLISQLSEIRSTELGTERWTYDRRRQRSILIWSLARYGDSVLDASIKASGSPDPLVRDSYYRVIGRIGGTRATDFLASVRPSEKSVDESDGINVLKTIDYYLQTPGKEGKDE